MPSPCTLALIVKNEASTIARTLESARLALGDGPTLVHDTGSTDGTVEAMQAWARSTGRALVIASRPFDDFASARNACLAHTFALGAKAPVCMVDAGVIVRGTLDPGAYACLRATGRKAGALTARIVLGLTEYERPQVFTPGWSYVGCVHEYADGPGHVRPPSGLVFDYCLRDQERPKRWLRDLALLEGDMSPRGRFYYAQTLDCLGRKTQALPAYLARAEMTDGWWQERVVAYMRCVPLARTNEEACTYAARALALDGSRGDVYLDLCVRYEAARDWVAVCMFASKAIMLKPREGALFARIDREARANVYAGDAYSSRGMYAIAIDHWRRALDCPGLDEAERAELDLCVEAGRREQERGA